MKNNVFEKEIIVPDVVQNKVDETLALIQKEGADTMKQNKNTRYYRARRNRIAAAMAVCLLGLSGLTAGAAAYHHWSQGIKGGMQATDAQQQKLTDEGMATVYGEDADYSDMAVTQKGVTVVPSMAIVDDQYAKVTFTVSGYQPSNNEQPGFRTWDVSIEGAEDEWRPNMGAGFYDGLIIGEDGSSAVYEDGSPLEMDESGTAIIHYADEKGDMEYIIDMYHNDENPSLVGRRIHITLGDLGYYGGKAEDVVTEVEGTWEFDVTLPAKSATQTFTSGQKVDCKYNDFIIDQVDISPLSTKIYYSLSEGETFESTNEAWDEMPYFIGYRLKDGSKIICNGAGGAMGYTDESQTRFSNTAGHSRLVDVDQIDKLIVLLTPGGDQVEIELRQK